MNWKIMEDKCRFKEGILFGAEWFVTNVDKKDMYLEYVTNLWPGKIFSNNSFQEFKGFVRTQIS